MTPQELTRWLAERPRVLDGAMGSELLRRGVRSAATLWGVGALLEAPETVSKLHADYREAGAEMLTAATFRVAPYSLRKASLEERARELARLAVSLARGAAVPGGRSPLVAAAMTSLEDCYRPDLVPDEATLTREHTATAQLLAGAQPDLLLLETFNTVREARAATVAAAATGLAVVASFTCTTGGRLLSGEDAGEAATALTLPGVAAVGVNCTRRVDILPALLRVAEATPLPLVAYANDAWFDEESGFLAAGPTSPDEYARCALAWVAAGVRLIGGCCGTGPAHVAALAGLLAGMAR